MTEDNCCGLYQGHLREGKIGCCRSREAAEKARLCGNYSEYPEFEGGCTKPKGHEGNCGKGEQ